MAVHPKIQLAAEHAKSFKVFWAIAFPTAPFACGLVVALAGLDASRTPGPLGERTGLLATLFLAGAALLMAILLAVRLWLVWRYLWEKPRVQLCFPRLSPLCRRSFIWSQKGGFSIAAEMSWLDAIATQKGVRPPSEFVVRDGDSTSRFFVWHLPDEGVRTVSAVLTALRADVDSPSSQQLVNDLQEAESALREAMQVATPFCFVIRSGAGFARYTPG